MNIFLLLDDDKKLGGMGERGLKIEYHYSQVNIPCPSLLTINDGFQG